MGDSQVRCILTGECIWDECVVFLLGPAGYGPHDVPPSKSPGGCNLAFGGSDTVGYWPLTLPVYARVGSHWGSIRSIEENEYTRRHAEVLGCDLVEMFSAVIEGYGQVISPAFKEAAEWYAQDQIAGAEVWKPRPGNEQHASLYATAQRQWRAKWADVAHVSRKAWDALCKPEFIRDETYAAERIWRDGIKPSTFRGPVSKYKFWEHTAVTIYPVCEYTQLAYREFLQEDESLDRLMSLLVLIDSLRVLGGELRPSVIHSDRDTEQCELRARTLRYMLAEAESRLSKEEAP